MEVTVREMQLEDTRMSSNNLVEDIFSKFFLLTNSQSNIARIVIKLNPNIDSDVQEHFSLKS